MSSARLARTLFAAPQTTTSWIIAAACTAPDVDPAWFFPDVNEDPTLDKRPRTTDPYAPGRAICRQCPVRPACLEAGLAEGPGNQHGLWGGHDPKQRRSLLRTRARQARAGDTTYTLRNTG